MKAEKFPIRIAVIQGGPSSEAEISRLSAKGVSSALQNYGHEVFLLELDNTLFSQLLSLSVDLVFPVAHGSIGEDGCLQGVLEILNLPYVGSGVLSSALCMNKVMARTLLGNANLPVAKGLAFSQRFISKSDSLFFEVKEKIGERIVVKPSESGSAIGVTRLDVGYTQSDLKNALNKSWELCEVALVEHFVKGREVTCGVFETGTENDPHHHSFPPTEILAHQDAFYNYRAKYTAGRSQHLCPADFDKRLTARIQELAISAHKTMLCRDYSRVDMIVGDGSDVDCITLLEVNTIPGFTPTSLFPEAGKAYGLDFSELCNVLAQRAFRRGPSKRNLSEPLPIP